MCIRDRVDIAPEEKGAMEFIEQCHDKVKISIAHTCSDYDTACEALEKGVGHMTHLYNAMPGINHREPGPVSYTHLDVYKRQRLESPALLFLSRYSLMQDLSF